ncbi:MAG: circadian clock KaiB family protein [Thermoanaerobaculia bacterium]|nr:circadian clock KaiB family protein [Thermoanaerobaculia bacterium]
MPEPVASRDRRSRLSLRLYVAGEAPNSLAARRRLERVLEDLDLESLELEVVDVMQEPGRVLADGVVVTPTLVRLAPLPERRMVGDLSAEDRLRQLLHLEGPMS